MRDTNQIESRPQHFNSQSISGVAEGLSKAGRITPLAIILSFVLLTEVVAMGGVLGTSGEPQLILTLFCVLFPPFIAVPFFSILYSRPIVFYAPGDFDKELKPADFAAAVAPKATARVADLMSDYIGTLEGRIANTISETEQLKDLISQQGSLNKKQIEEGIANISREITDGIKISDVTKFDLSEVGGKTISIPIDDNIPVSDVLDFLYFEINKVSSVEVYTYSKAWVLENTKTSERLFDIGSFWAEKNGLREDNRLAKSVGLLPGETFKVIIFRKTLRNY
ncbi:hypothetical protein [Methylobacterium flocculans]|uniref:hypothetical protein n=1 Tax=Methylobacterium flocculans TaxID=2984843 RepID=UPI0021F35184|nr:hypothetical protein [Methylobacterium sp. FF17]